MTLHPSVEKWLASLRQRGRSEATITAYRSTMLHYLCDPLTATVDDVEDWYTALAGNVNTRARALSCVRSYYKWALRYDLITTDPTRRLDMPSVPKGAPRYIQRHQLDTLLRDTDGDVRRAVVLGAWAGLRVSEAAALTWDNVDTDRMCLNIRGGKGEKSRAVPMHTVLLDAILPNTGGNVVTGGGITYTSAALQRRVNRAMQAVGVNATFHQLRHRYGTMTYGITGDPLAVAAAMGHASLNSTRIYAAISDDAMARIAAAAVR